MAVQRPTCFPINMGSRRGPFWAPLLYLLYIKDFPGVIEDNICPDPSHGVTETLFGRDCRHCLNLTLYVDDGLYVTSSRNVNQYNIENVFHKIKNYLNAHWLQINESTTVLSEIMSQQKRAKIQGILPYLTINETIKGKIQDRHITDSQSFQILGVNIKKHISLGGKRHCYQP